ncbi:MAG: rhodanese-like domain-containing protein [Pyrinomonadaceae bacterium]
MRAFILMMAMSLLAVFVACNSQEGNRGSGNTAQKTQTSQTPQPVQAKNPLDSVRRITAEELHKLWEKGEVLVVDTRTEPAFKQAHIRGAILIPHNDFPSRADELPRSKMIVAYCACPAEQTSGAAVLTLNARGFQNAAALLGGIDAWRNAGYPVETK